MNNSLKLLVFNVSVYIVPPSPCPILCSTFRINFKREQEGLLDVQFWAQNVI